MVGESVNAEANQRTANEFNAAQMAHMAAHQPTRRNIWGDIEYGNPGGTHKGHDLDVVYPVLGHAGVSYLQFDNGESVNTNHAPEPQAIRDAQPTVEDALWSQYWTYS